MEAYMEMCRMCWMLCLYIRFGRRMVCFPSLRMSCSGAVGSTELRIEVLQGGGGKGEQEWQTLRKHRTNGLDSCWVWRTFPGRLPRK